METKKVAAILVLALCGLLFGCTVQQTFTVSEVVQGAEALNGKTIRVRGVAYVWVKPSLSEMWMYGGCLPASAGSPKWDQVIGWLVLYEALDPVNAKPDGTPRETTGIRISDSSFHCDGNVCGLTCQPFTVGSHQTYEFTGTLRVDEAGLVLENIDLEQSGRLVNGERLPIVEENFSVFFP